jgi:hypothetical protein
MTPDSKTNFVQRDTFRKNLRRLFDILPHGFFIGAKSCTAVAQRAAADSFFGGAKEEGGVDTLRRGPRSRIFVRINLAR